MTTEQQLLIRAERLIRERAHSSDWTTAMPPDVVATLAAWLRSAAADAEHVGPNPWAVAFARAVLEEQQR